MKTEFLSEALLMKSLVEDSVINGTRRERRRGMKRLIIMILAFFLVIKVNAQQSKFYFFEHERRLIVFQLNDTYKVKYYFIKNTSEELKNIKDRSSKIYPINKRVFALNIDKIKFTLYRNIDTILFRPIEYSNNDFTWNYENDSCSRTQFVLNRNKEVPFNEFDLDDKYCSRNYVKGDFYTYIKDTTIKRVGVNYDCYVFSHNGKNQLDCLNMGDCADVLEIQYIDKNTFLPIEKRWIYYVGHTKKIKKKSEFKLIDVIDAEPNTPLESLFKKCKKCKGIKRISSTN
jgi:hypothetical protein